jgi:DNA-binding winged helix-turn-helix (wHTH) protein/tetratricopeptide (TPR) repeat protein
VETPAGTIYRFGPFEVATAAGELLRQGKRISLQEQPFRLLVILLESSGKVVMRAEIQSRIWQENTFVDFDSSLRVAVGKLRTALGDDAANPRYIETVPRQGYRFLGHAALGAATQPADSIRPVVVVEVSAPSRTGPARSNQVGRWAFAAVAIFLACVAATAFFFSRGKKILNARDTLVLADFVNTTGDPVFDGTLRQGLTVQLEQSPYLSLLSEEHTGQVLRMMGKADGTRLTPEIALEVCERSASAAVLDGSISSLGSHYVLGLRSRDCRTGAVFDEQQMEVASKEDLLSALSRMGDKFRIRAGESLATMQQHDKTLEEVTTHSLEALKAFSAALKIQRSSGSASAIPFLKRAIEIDPNFAIAYAYLGRLYDDIGDVDRAAESSTRAYQLRDHSSDEEKYFITAHYQIVVTGNLEKAQRTCEEWAEAYPREKGPWGFRGGLIFSTMGKFEEAIEQSKEVLRLDPDLTVGYSMLAANYGYLNQLTEARNVLRMASTRGLNNPDFSILRYDFAFVEDDRAEMERQLALGEKNSNAEAWLDDRQAFALAYYGRLKEARRWSQQASQLALETDHKERAAQFQVGTALWEAFFGENDAARRSAAAALALSKSRYVEYGAAFTFAFTGEHPRATALTNDLEQRFPEDTSVRFNFLPALRARLALNKGDPARAIEALQPAALYEFGGPPTSFLGFGALYPIYVRGNAYLDAHQGKQAAAEYQKILDHPGIVISDPIGALARLQLGRAFALSGDKTKAKTAYQDFLMLWKDADPDIRILKRARVEYAELQ